MNSDDDTTRRTKLTKLVLSTFMLEVAAGRARPDDTFVVAVAFVTLAATGARILGDTQQDLAVQADAGELIGRYLSGAGLKGISGTAGDS